MTILPTCHNDGYVGQKCIECDDFVISKALDKLTHSYIELQKNSDCENSGYIAKFCEHCGEKEITQTINKLGHNYILKELIIDHAIPSKDTNNIEQIIDFANNRLAYLDKLMVSYL